MLSVLSESGGYNGEGRKESRSYSASRNKKEEKVKSILSLFQIQRAGKGSEGAEKVILPRTGERKGSAGRRFLAF